MRGPRFFHLVCGCLRLNDREWIERISVAAEKLGVSDVEEKFFATNFDFPQHADRDEMFQIS
jgi:hypothetical protein